MDNDDVRSITLRVAIFFGLTTFTLCIAIFYIDSILVNTREMVDQKDSIITVMKKDLSSQEMMIKENERQIEMLRDQANDAKELEPDPAE
ncbi:MAG TPA: hypothetical protein DCX54_02135 [Flavobacteriales bacterium]|nr:hypothetical protein [Flavobacteriales bacterium]